MNAETRGAAGSILAFRNDRLGGRLNAILTGMRIARRHDVPLRIFWPDHEGTAAEMQNPADLFAADFIAECFMSKDEARQALHEAVDIADVPAGMTEAAFRTSLAQGVSYLSKSATAQLLLPWETKQALADLPLLMAQMRFTPRIHELIAQIDHRLGGMTFRSYHLRRGDIIDDDSPASHNLWPNKYIPRVIYEWHMKRQLQQGDTPLVIFSDAPQEAAAFSALSARVICFPDLVGDTPLTALQRDFLELFTMSRSACIFAPPSSAFSGTAAAIGNSQVVDIEADLGAEDRLAAMDELVTRLETRPEMFLTQSDAGQNLPFIDRHLTAKGQGARVRGIAMTQIDRGMDRAYVFPFLAERLLADGDYAALDRVIDIASTRPSYREEQSGTLFAQGSLADLSRGRIDSAMRRYHIGQWFHPINRLTAEVFWYAASRGVLTPDNTYPFDPDLMRRAGSVFRGADGPPFSTLMQELRRDGIRPMQYPVNMEVRDWRQLQGKKLNFSFANRTKILRQIDMITQSFHRDPDAPALLSARGALLAVVDQRVEARQQLEAAVLRSPGQPLYRKRLADFLAVEGEGAGALDHLRAACELSDGHPCYLISLANLHLSQGDHAAYAEVMTGLKDRPTDLIELRFIIADFLRRSSRTLPEVPAYLDDLLRLAPGSQRLLTQKSKVLQQLGRFDASLDILCDLRRAGRPDYILRPKLESLHQSYRQTHNDEAADRWLRARGVGADFSFY